MSDIIETKNDTIIAMSGENRTAIAKFIENVSVISALFSKVSTEYTIGNKSARISAAVSDKIIARALIDWKLLTRSALYLINDIINTAMKTDHSKKTNNLAFKGRSFITVYYKHKDINIKTM